MVSSFMAGWQKVQIVTVIATLIANVLRKAPPEASYNQMKFMNFLGAYLPFLLLINVEM